MPGVNHLKVIALLEIVLRVLARKVTTLIDLVQNVAVQNVAGQNGPVVNVQKDEDQKAEVQRDAAPKAEGLKDVGLKVHTGLRERLSQSKAKSPGFRRTFMATLMA